MLLKINNLSVAYDGKEVLRCEELSVYDKDFIGIYGPNGGGKTTLVKAILQSVPYKGSIEYCDKLMKDGVRSIGYLPQVSNVDKAFPITVFDVILSGLQGWKGLWKKYTPADYEKAERIIARARIQELADKYIGKLSGGEFQRVMLCRALISSPALLILDEPNNFVDNQLERELYQLLEDLNEDLAIMVISHDMEMLSKYIKSKIYVNHDVYQYSVG